MGDKLPDVMLTEGQPGYGKPVEVSLRSLFAGKRGILFAVPGAFTPGCSKARGPAGAGAGAGGAAAAACASATAAAATPPHPPAARPL